MLHPPTVPLSQYLPKHYHDHRPKCVSMSFYEFTEFMKRNDVTDIQWVVEWWRISSMVNYSFKDNCVPLVRLRCCSHYSTCRIARQFGDHQGASSNDGSFHKLAFSYRILGRICESWPRQRVTKASVFLNSFIQLWGCKKWLEADMKWVLIDEKAYKRSNKRKRNN